MLVNIFGGLGSGKTLLLTIIAYMNKHKRIISNFHLNEIEYEEFSIIKFIKSEYDNCIILLDEGYVYLDSRLSMSSQNRLMSYTLFQSRKKTVEIYITVQLMFSIDIRYRSLTDYCIECYQTTDSFMYAIYRPKDIETQAITHLLRENAAKFYKFYDTNEVISVEKDSVKYLTDKEKLDKMKLVAPKVNDEYKKHFISKHPNYKKISKISKSYIKIWCLKMELDSDYVSLLYDYIISTFY